MSVQWHRHRHNQLNLKINPSVIAHTVYHFLSYFLNLESIGKKVRFLDQISVWKCTGIVSVEFSSHILFIATAEPALVASCKERPPLLKDQL